MLLDKYTLTKSFENLLSFHGPSQSLSAAGHQSAASASFAKRVNLTMGRVDPLLKTLQVQPSPPEGLVQAYLIHIADRSETNFRKILDLKGVRKQDQPHLIELFTIHRDSPSATGRQLVQYSPLLTPLLSSSSMGSGGSLVGIGAGSSAATGAGATQGRFDAASLGEKLLNAARDGVDRLGTAAATSGAAAGGAGSGSGSGAVTGLGLGLGIVGAGQGASGGAEAPAPEKATINENLKNIGKFFRRDIGGIGGLGARFGKRDVTPTGQHEDGPRP